MALMVPRKYITQKLLNEAREIVSRTQDAHYVQLSPAISVNFGTVGLSLDKYYDHHIYHKHVNDWMNKTANEINAEFAEQEWSR
jgi:hypothetical protein